MKRAVKEAAADQEDQRKELGASNAEVTALKLAVAETEAAKAATCQDLQRSRDVQGSFMAENFDLMEDIEELQGSLAATKKTLAKNEVSIPAIDLSFNTDLLELVKLCQWARLAFQHAYRLH